jgi:ABC-type uncharacterized transport system ATPase subunit
MLTTELDKITKIVPPTSFGNHVTLDDKNVEDLIKAIITHYNFTLEEHSKFKEGVMMEKFNTNNIVKMMLEIMLIIIDNNKRVFTDNKTDDLVFNQNKKIIRDLTFGLLTVLQNYSVNDKEMKILLLGKIIQSLHGR